MKNRQIPLLLIMGKFCFISLAVSIIFSSSNYASEVHRDYTETQPITMISTQCTKDFNSFIEDFSESVDMQKAFTRFPLERLHIDIDADPEPKPVLESIRKKDLKFPLMPNAEDRKAKGLTLRIDEQNVQRAKVTLLKEDTDYQVSYFFSKEKCWMLVRIEDWSL